MTITVSVKLFASLAKYSPSKTKNSYFEVKLDKETTVECLASKLGIPKDQIRTISLNGKIVEIQTVLAHKNTIILFPAIAGG